VLLLKKCARFYSGPYLLLFIFFNDFKGVIILTNIYNNHGGISTTPCGTTIVFLDIAITHNVSETGFRLRLQMEPIQLGPIDRDRRRQNAISETLCVLSENRTMDNVQKHNNSINIPPSLTFTSYLLYVT
jgi:hypothetical protein